MAALGSVHRVTRPKRVAVKDKDRPSRAENFRIGAPRSKKFGEKFLGIGLGWKKVKRSGKSVARTRGSLNGALESRAPARSFPPYFLVLLGEHFNLGVRD